MEELQKQHNVIVGVRQTVKFLKKGQVKKVFLAKDADKEVVAPIISSCCRQMISVQTVDTKKELGKACGIEVDCAAAAIIC